MNKDIFYILSLVDLKDKLIKKLFIESKSQVFVGDLFSFIIEEHINAEGKKLDKETFFKKENDHENIIKIGYQSIYKKLEKKFIEKNSFFEKGSILPKNFKDEYENFKGLLFHTKYHANNLKVIFFKVDKNILIKNIIKKEMKNSKNVISHLYYRSLINILIKKFILKRKLFIIYKFLKENNLQYIELNIKNKNTLLNNDINQLKAFLN